MTTGEEVCLKTLQLRMQKNDSKLKLSRRICVFSRPSVEILQQTFLTALLVSEQHHAKQIVVFAQSVVLCVRRDGVVLIEDFA